MALFKRLSTQIDIIEQALPVYAWASEDGQDQIAVIERDICDLMRLLGKSQFLLSEKDDQHEDEIKRILLALLEVGDAFDRIFRNIQAKMDQITPQMKIWIGNFRTIRRLLDKVILDQGAVRIQNLDQGFDPHWHKVSETVIDPAQPDGTIVEEIKKGFMWKTQVLRKSEVIVVRSVANGSDEAPPE